MALLSEAVALEALIAAPASVLVIALLRRWATRLHLVDRPGGRKQHCQPTAVVGGLGIAVGSAVAGWTAFAAVGGEGASALRVGSLTLALTVVLVAGVIDDRWGLGTGLKFILQSIAGFIAITIGGLQLGTLAGWPGGGVITTGWLAAPLAGVAIVGFINAFNMIDGVDGLAGSTALVMLLSLAFAAIFVDAPGVMLVATAVAAACLGFLGFNLRTPWRSRAQVFLGDAGSMTLGLLIVWLAIDLSQREGAPVSPMGIAWVLALPVTDTLNLMVRRFMRRQSPFRADRNHLHHILQRTGFTPGQTAIIFSALTFAMSVTGLAMALIGVPDLLMGLLLLFFTVAHYFFVRYGWRTVQALRRLRRWWVLSSSPGATIPERVSLLGLYVMAIAIPLAAQPLLMLAVIFILFASLSQHRAMITSLSGLPLARWMLILAAWLSLTVFIRPAPELSGWVTMFFLSGIFALPLGWWLERWRQHGALLFAASVVMLVINWLASADWGKLEAGDFRKPEHWGDVQTSGLLLVLMLVVLVGVAGYGIAYYRGRWRARASLFGSVTVILLLTTLLLGLQFQTAVVAGVFGALAMAAAVVAMTRQKRVRFGVSMAALTTIALGGFLANSFSPHDLSWQSRYLSPLQTIVATLGNDSISADRRDAGVTARLDHWTSTLQVLRVELLTGIGRPTIASGKDQRASHSAYTALLLTGGLPAMVFFLGMIQSWKRGIIDAVRFRAWSVIPAVIAIGLITSLLVFSLLAPAVDSLSNGLLVTLTFAIGLIARLDTSKRAYESLASGGGTSL